LSEFRVHGLAAAKKPKRRRKVNPVTTIRVDSRVWAEAQRISGGDSSRINIISRTTVVVREEGK